MLPNRRERHESHAYVLDRAIARAHVCVTWETMQGDIHRDATFARLLVGGELRFGDRIQPHAHLGLGFQGIDHDSRFMMTGGQEREGPDAGLTLDLMWSIGVGTAVRINEQWTIGALMSGVGVAQNTSSETLRAAFEGGFYASYGQLWMESITAVGAAN